MLIRVFFIIFILFVSSLVSAEEPAGADGDAPDADDYITESFSVDGYDHDQRLQIGGSFIDSIVSGRADTKNVYVSYEHRLFSDAFGVIPGDLGIGGGYSKEGTWLYDGHQLSLFGTYRHGFSLPVPLPFQLDQHWSVVGTGGIVYAIYPTLYHSYSEQRSEHGELVSYKWSKPSQGRNGFSLDPVATIQLERLITSSVVYGFGIRSRMIDLHMQNARFEPRTGVFTADQTENRIQFTNEFFIYTAFLF